MLMSHTTYPFLRDDCIAILGAEKGVFIWDTTEALYKDLQSHADYKNNDMIRDHMQRKIFPLMAYYKALLSNGYQVEEALALARKESTKVALKKKTDNGGLAKMPGAYLLYRMCAKSHMQKNFPIEGWDTTWVRCDGKEIHFDLTRCIYHDLTIKHGCPELCTVYCENDIIAFSGLLPKIRFERKNTLGNGADRCDFHLIKM